MKKLVIVIQLSLVITFTGCKRKAVDQIEGPVYMVGGASPYIEVGGITYMLHFLPKCKYSIPEEDKSDTGMIRLSFGEEHLYQAIGKIREPGPDDITVGSRLGLIIEVEELNMIR